MSTGRRQRRPSHRRSPAPGDLSQLFFRRTCQRLSVFAETTVNCRISRHRIAGDSDSSIDFPTLPQRRCNRSATIPRQFCDREGAELLGRDEGMRRQRVWVMRELYGQVFSLSRPGETSGRILIQLGAMVTLGISTIPTVRSTDIAILARRAEELGFDSIWVPEQHTLPVAEERMGGHR